MFSFWGEGRDVGVRGGCLLRVGRVLLSGLDHSRGVGELRSCRGDSVTSILRDFARRRELGICGVFGISRLTSVFPCCSGTGGCIRRLGPRVDTSVLRGVSSSRTVSVLSRLGSRSGGRVVKLLRGGTRGGVVGLSSCSSRAINDRVDSGCVMVGGDLAVGRTVDYLMGRTNRRSGVCAVCMISGRGGFCNVVGLGSLVVTEGRSSLLDLYGASCPAFCSSRVVDSYLGEVGSCNRMSVPVVSHRGHLLKIVAPSVLLRTGRRRLVSSCTGLNNLDRGRSFGRSTFMSMGGHVP